MDSVSPGDALQVTGAAVVVAGAVLAVAGVAPSWPVASASFLVMCVCFVVGNLLNGARRRAAVMAVVAVGWAGITGGVRWARPLLTWAGFALVLVAGGYALALGFGRDPLAALRS
ncbi:hypothetical protein GCM10009037_08410 [Halarchaeum grantii]|uniref:Uncharacterized protein n=1 Tax=Halarchaeum grantii TaxID=1193105 RepID=A0A830F7M4_9EURY|nr:hypothetical protein [Halarchaeum grantii]GGL27124.1 hypothetical protein GCM10009037_08410 [Halarchaeum grantii]